MKLIAQVFAVLSLIFGVFGCVTHSPLATVEDRQKLSNMARSESELAVLFVGNSYSFGVPKAFSKVVLSHGKKASAEQVTHGGWTLEQHSNNQATLRMIQKGEWDVVVIQEQSRIPAKPAQERAAKMFPPLRQLVAVVRENDAVPILYQTWGRRDGDNEVPGDNFFAMQQRLRKGYQAASKDAGGVLVAPVGDAWEAEIRAGRGNKLFTEDGSHPTPAGDRLTATVFYQTIYGQPAER